MHKSYSLWMRIFAWVMLTIYVFPQTNPTAFDLSGGNYSFTSWASSSTAGTYPSNMYFHRSAAKSDPGISTSMSEDYSLAYSLTSNARIYGEGANGFSFTNSGSGQNFVGDAVLGLKTTNRTNIQVTWTGRMLSSITYSGTQDRFYNIRLQYRVGNSGSWTDVPGPIEFQCNSSSSAYKSNGTNSVVGPTTLPSACDNQTEIQLRWLYFLASGTKGSRPTLGIDEISVTSSVNTLTPPSLTADNTSNTVDNDIEITFSDESWRAAITSVKIGSTALASGDYDKTQTGKLVLKPSVGNTLLTTAGSKSVTVVATGYSDATCTQQIDVGAVNINHSTATINAALALNTSRTVTVTAKDQYDNLVSGYVFKYDVLYGNDNSTTTETYNVNSASVTTDLTNQTLSATNSSGVTTFNIDIPATVDGNDGISVQVKLNDGTSSLGSSFDFFGPTTPSISVSTSSLSAFANTQVGQTSANSTYTVSGANLTSDITITAPTGFEVSTSSSSGFGGSVVLTKSGSSVATTTIYVRFAPGTVNSFSNNITHTATDATQQNVAVSGTSYSQPSASVSTASSVTSSGATLNGSVTANNASTTVTFEYGLTDSYGSTATASQSPVTGTSSTSVSAAVSGLSASTTYHYRVKAENSANTVYSSDQTFSTSANAPTVTTATPTVTGSTTATGGGDVTSDGGAVITARGVCVDVTANPTTGSAFVVTDASAATGTFTSSITGLSPNTLYHVRAYATNSVNTSYGSDITFTTSGLSTPTASQATEYVTDGFTANWNAVNGATSYRLDVSTSNTFTTAGTVASDLFFSKYGEGNTNNRWIEIYNGTGSAVDLSNYTVKQAPGASSWDSDISYSLTLSGTLANNSTYVISASSNALTAVTDIANLKIVWSNSTAGGRIPYFTGDDAMGLFKNGSLIDVIGTPTGNATSAVAGTSGATQDHSIYRKSSIHGPNSNWSNSAGTNTTNSEWTVYSNDYCTGVGTHTMDGAASASYVTGYQDKTVSGTSEVVTGLSSNTKYYYRVRAYSANSTSANSNVITAKTALGRVTSGNINTGNPTANIGGNSCIHHIAFNNVTNPGTVSASYIYEEPSDASSISGNVSKFRWVIEPSNGFQCDSYTLRFDLANMPSYGGIHELAEGNNNTLKLWKRSSIGSGSFSDMGFMTYHRNGTVGDQSDDYLETDPITTGFSEFVFGSNSETMPVELLSFTGVRTNNSVLLKWSTASELNSSHFVIQRKNAATDKNWIEIAKVQGAGNSNSRKDYAVTDGNFTASGKYSYRLIQFDNDGTSEVLREVEVDVNNMPTSYSLSQNYPNPFNPGTVISYSLPQDSRVEIKVYSITGQLVKTLVNQTQPAGYHSVQFDGTGLTSGLYIYQLKAGSFVQTRKMTLLK